jgi:CRP/FNR family cyclic AMP-dependent transcriptional regulator
MEGSNKPSIVEMSQILSHLPIFSGVNFHELQMLANECSVITLGPNEEVIKKGEIGQTLYAIMKGKVNFSLTNSNQEQVHIDTMHPGDSFGEIGIFKKIPRLACITTETPCTFLTITAQDFLKVYQYFTPFSRDNIQAIIAKRLALIHQESEKLL